MDAGIGVHAIEKAELVGMLRGFGHELGDPETTFPVSRERINRAGVRFLPRLGFVIKGIELRRATAHAEEYDSLGSCR